MAYVGVGLYIVAGVVNLEGWELLAIVAWVAGGVAAMLVLLAGAVAGWLLARRGERYLAWSAAETMARDPRPPVLYLRAFTDEPATRRSLTRVGRHNVNVHYGLGEEECLQEQLSRIGPFVAIGRPSDPLPQLGAHRLYVEGADWRTVVLGLMDQAAALVIRIGRGEGLAWEIGQALTRFPPERLLFVVPRDLVAYSEFKYRADPHLPRPLPPFPPPPPPARSRLIRPRPVSYQLLGFLGFSPEGDGRLVQLEFQHEAPSRKALRREYARGLAPFTERLLTAAPRSTSSPGIAAYPRWRFRAPPTWPQPPRGWIPPLGWRPDPSWPPPPTGWTFWELEEPEARQG
jgi:hypothetical protein